MCVCVCVYTTGAVACTWLREITRSRQKVSSIMAARTRRLCTGDLSVVVYVAFIWALVCVIIPEGMQTKAQVFGENLYNHLASVSRILSICIISLLWPFSCQKLDQKSKISARAIQASLSSLRHQTHKNRCSEPHMLRALTRVPFSTFAHSGPDTAGVKRFVRSVKEWTPKTSAASAWNVQVYKSDFGLTVSTCSTVCVKSVLCVCFSGSDWT